MSDNMTDGVEKVKDLARQVDAKLRERLFHEINLKQNLAVEEPDDNHRVVCGCCYLQLRVIDKELDDLYAQYIQIEEDR